MRVDGGRRTGRCLLLAYGAWMALLAAAYYLWEPGALRLGRTGVVATVGASSTFALLAGVLAYQPARRSPWLLLTAAVFLHALARVLFGVVAPGSPLGGADVRAVPVYLAHLAMVAFMVAALLGFAGRRGRRRDLPALIDAAIVVFGAGLLTWVAVVQPWAAGHDPAQTAIAIRTGYVVRDVLILAALGRFLLAVRWNPSAALITVGTLTLLAYDAMFRSGILGDEWLGGSPADLGWLAFSAAAGAAALVPSMASVAGRGSRSDENSVTALVLVAVSALVPFALLVLDPTEGSANGPAGLELAAAGMLTLVLIRLTFSAVRLRRSLSQAGVVGDASAELVSAVDLPAIDAALRTAAGRLFGPRPSVATRLSTGDIPGPAPDGSRGELRIPLRLPGTDLASGTLVVKASPASLAAGRAPLEVVAAQASLALARVRLNEEVLGRRSDEYFRALVQNSADVIVIVGDDARIRYASPSAANLFDAPGVEGTRLPDLLDPADRRAGEDLLAAVYAGRAGDAAMTVRTDWRLAGAVGRWVEVACVDLRADEAIRGVVITLRDVTERRLLEERLQDQAFHDPLTGLGNRALFTAGVEEAIQTHQGDAYAGILFIDLDDFKVINDGFGHAIGDGFLREVSGRIAAATGRHDGLAARVGGDEFAVLVRDLREPDEIDLIAAGIVAALGRPVTVDAEVLRCGASIGVATTADAGTADELIRHADLALYEAKASGKQQWRRYDPAMGTAITRAGRRRRPPDGHAGPGHDRRRGPDR